MKIKILLVSIFLFFSLNLSANLKINSTQMELVSMAIKLGKLANRTLTTTEKRLLKKECLKLSQSLKDIRYKEYFMIECKK